MQPKTSAEKELLKENLYNNQVQNILRKHKDNLQAAYNESHEVSKDGQDLSLIREQYAAESAIIARVMANERSALLNGVALGALVFASVRYGPRYLVTKLNPEKARLLKEADAVAEKANTRWIQKTVSFAFEAALGALGGWRGYNMVSSQNKSSYEEISKLPLCAGRSIVAEEVCPDWVNLVKREIDSNFWKNLDNCRFDGGDQSEDCRLRDPQRWHVVRNFADNCIKRTVFEGIHRKEHGLSAGSPVVIPKPGVPDDILLSLDKKN
ncbi:hypothetical protein ACHAWF_016343 [Thalassiosira exigua]